MADSSDPKDLILRIQNFIKQEREVFGDFSTDRQTNIQMPKQEKVQSESAKQASSKETTDKDQTPNEQEVKNTVTDPATTSTDADFDSQEGLFNKDESNKVYYQIDKCNTLEELEELCLKAEVLRTDLEGTQLVFGVGNPHADLMLIGEAPGAEEDKQGEPFVGKAGQLLNKILAAIDFKREDVYIANILKHRPPNNRNPKPEERKRSLPFLLRQIDLINPKLILALGKVSAQTLLDNNDSLSSMRGEFHKFHGKYELLATYHPAALLRHAKWKRPTWEDVQLLRKRYDELGGKP